MSLLGGYSPSKIANMWSALKKANQAWRYYFSPEHRHNLDYICPTYEWMFTYVTQIA